MSEERHGGRIEGYAIVSEDGMLADAARRMPSALIFEADQKFFAAGLNRAGVVVHGGHSQEQVTGADSRYRLVLTRTIPALAPHPTNARALLWNPAGASLEEALAALGRPGADIAVIGGPEAFALFLGRYDVFHLTRAPGVRLPGGRPVFPEVPVRTPEDVLASHGMVPDEPVALDAEKGVVLVSWRPGTRAC